MSSAKRAVYFDFGRHHIAPKLTLREEWENSVGIKRKKKNPPAAPAPYRLDDYVYATPMATLTTTILDPDPRRSPYWRPPSWVFEAPPPPMPPFDLGTREHVYYWGEGGWMPRSREVIGATLFIEATLHPMGRTVAQITAWQQPHGEIRQRLGYNWRRVPAGRWCVDYEVPGWGPGTMLVCHKERSFADAARAFAWIELLVFMTEQMSVRDWETLRGPGRRTVNPWGDCPMT